MFDVLFIAFLSIGFLALAVGFVAKTFFGMEGLGTTLFGITFICAGGMVATNMFLGGQ